MVKIFLCFFCTFETHNKDKAREHFAKDHNFGGGRGKCVFCMNLVRKWTKERKDKRIS